MNRLNSTSHAPATANSASILIVDDDDAILTLMCYCLQRAGYKVVCAAGRASVLAILASGQFDLVITDILMPELDGTEVIAATRAHQPDAAVLAMSGGGPHLTAEYCLKLARCLGAPAPLLKPFHVEELLAAVQNALQTRSHASAAYVADGSGALM